MEQFSWKINWKLTEEFLYNQSCKKDFHINGEDEKKRHKVGTSTLKGRKSLHRWTLTLGSQWVKPQIGHPSLGVLCGGDTTLWLLGEPLGQIEGLEKPRLYLQRVCVCWLGTDRVERALHWQLPPCHTLQSELSEHPSLAHSTPHLGRRSGSARPWEKTQSSYTETAQEAWGVVWVGQWQPLSMLTQAAPQETLCPGCHGLFPS